MSATGATTTTSPHTTTTLAPQLVASDATWHLPVALSREVVLPINSNIGVFGGLRSAGTSKSIYQIDPMTGISTTIGTMPTATHDAAGATIGASYIVFGGGGTTETAAVQSFSLSNSARTHRLGRQQPAGQAGRLGRGDGERAGVPVGRLRRQPLAAERIGDDRWHDLLHRGPAQPGRSLPGRGRVERQAVPDRRRAGPQAGRRHHDPADRPDLVRGDQPEPIGGRPLARRGRGPQRHDLRVRRPLRRSCHRHHQHPQPEHRPAAGGRASSPRPAPTWGWRWSANRPIWWAGRATPGSHSTPS